MSSSTDKAESTTDGASSEGEGEEIMARVHGYLEDASERLIYSVGRSNARIGAALPRLSPSIDYPKFSLGFQHFVHAKKRSLAAVSFEGRKVVYDVVHMYSSTIDDHDDDIKSAVASYFGEGKPAVTSKMFYGTWETLLVLGLVPTSAGFTSLQMMDGGTMTQAIMYFRDKFSKHSRSDKYILREDLNVGQHCEKHEEFLSHCERDGRLERSSEGTVDLVTLCLGTRWPGSNIVREQSSLGHLCEMVSAALGNLKKGGTIVCGVFETFTETSNKILYSVLTLFNEMIITKPLAFDPVHDDKFIVFRGLNAADNKVDKVREVLDDVSSALKGGAGSKFLVGLLPDVTMSDEYLSVIRKANTDISNRQFAAMGNALDFVNRENYHGEEYEKYRKRQMERSAQWVERFLPPPEKAQATLKKAKEESEVTIMVTKIRAKSVSNKLG